MKPHNYIPLTDCQHGKLYRLDSRNLSLGVFNSKTNAFIGIRTKFGSRYLTSEYHYDTGAPFGTAYAIELLDATLPEDVEPIELLSGTVDRNTNRPVKYDETCKGTDKWPWYFIDTGEHDDTITACVIPNEKLFEWMKQQEVLHEVTG